MRCAQEYAMDLPLKVLVYEAEDGRVWAVLNNQVALASKDMAEGCGGLVQKVNRNLGNY